jgi:hypothetical protein
MDSLRRYVNIVLLLNYIDILHCEVNDYKHIHLLIVTQGLGPLPSERHP